LAKDDLAGAAKHYAESLEIRKQLGDGSMIAASQLSLAGLALEQGNLEKTSSTAHDAAQKLHDLGDSEGEVVARNLLARVLLAQKNVGASQIEIGAARELAAKDRTSMVATDIVSAQLLAQQKKAGEAVRLLAQVLNRTKSMDYLLGQMQARLALADIKISSGEGAHVAKDLRSLEDQSARLGFKLVQRRSEELLKNVQEKPGP
jgi:hypothetical protein